MTTQGTEKFFDDICEYIPYELRERKLGLKDKWQKAPLIQWWNEQGEYNISFSSIEQIGDGYRKKYYNFGNRIKRFWYL